MVTTSPELTARQTVTGMADNALEVAAPDRKAYDHFLQAKRFTVPGVASVRNNVVLREVKYVTAMPVP